VEVRFFVSFSDARGMSKRRRQPSQFVRAALQPVTPRRTNGVTDDTLLLQRARKLWSEKRWDDALAVFEQALAQTPANARALIDAARAFGSRYQFDRADALLQTLVRQHPKNSELIAQAGRSYALLSRYPEAVKCYEQARALVADDPGVQLELARLYERLHRLDDASELIGRVTKARPECSAAQLTKAKIERRLKLDSQAEITLRRLLAKPVSEPDIMAEAWAELAQLRDRSGDYDGAMEAVIYGKQLMLPRDAAERKTSDFILARFEKMYETLRPSDLRRWAEQSHENASHPGLILLTGFPRSGTTLLEQVLDGHPQVVSSEERDIMGFEVFPALVASVGDRTSLHDVLDRASLELLKQQQGLYFKFNAAWVGKPLEDRLLLDKNPGSTLLLPIFLRVFPQFKTLFAIRDPRDVILSCFMLHLPLNPLSVNFLTLERAARKYALDMSAWLKLREMFPVPWLEVRYEDLVADLPAQTRRALGFLNIPWDPAVLKFHEHAQSKPVLSPTYAAVTQPVHNRAIGRWRNYADYLEPVLPILAPLVKAFGYTG
jgi:tetratricopeptide (TPR) repeat protein